MSELRITSTNSVNDSRGRAFGLEGNDFIYILAAFIAALGMYIVLSYVMRFALVVALAFALPVLLVPTAWVLFLRHNKPDGYAEDFFDDLVNGEGWSLVARSQPVTPRRDDHAQ
jgi:hypothetical protein